MVWAGALGCLLWVSCSSEPRRNRYDDDDDDTTTTTTVTSSSTGGVGGSGGSSSSSSSISSSSAGTGGSPGTGGSGGSPACLMGPCAPKAPECMQVSSCCIALEDNTFKPVFALRMGQLTIAKPDVFAKGVVANIIANAAQMNLDQCNLAGAGTLSWLLEVNTTTKMLTTGGAKPAADPTAGYCFVNEVMDGLFVAPVETNVSLNLGSLSANVGDLLLPVFLDAAGSSHILLPIHKVGLSGTLSADSNCIGKYNADTLDPANNCLAEPPNILSFTNDGMAFGFISLEDADSIIVEPLAQSLCVLLSGDPATYGDGGSPAKCKRDPMTSEIIYQGDWCSATDTPASPVCYDASRFQADFAASAVQGLGKCP
jgi:hypothetical protein